MTKLVTAALPYANGPLHVGHVAGVHLPGDIYARFLKLMGESVVTLCGTDDHGVGIELAAKKEGMPEIDLVGKYRKIIMDSLERIGITYDVFSQTHSEVHMKNSAEFFTVLSEKGFIEKRDETMAYCNDCNNFLPDRYIEGTCPKCGSEGARGDQCEKCGNMLNSAELIDPCCKMCDSKNVSSRETYTYFFKLSSFQQPLTEWIDSHENDWKPNVLSAAKKWLKEGLEDRAISRDIRWGIPVPGDEQKKMYVWFEAPIAYISFLQQFAKEIGNDTLCNEMWGMTSNAEISHFIGKDNIVFHTIIWPALLMAHGGYKLPTNVPGNDFVNLENAKISTSRNHAVWLHEIVEYFNGDAIRYYLTHCIPEKKDSNFTWNEFKERNNELANILGNLLNRLTTFSVKNFNGTVSKPEYATQTNRDILDSTLAQGQEITRLLSKYAFRDGLKELLVIFQNLNKYVHDNAPWTLIKTDPAAAEAVINTALDCLIKTTILMEPFLPETARKILDTFGIPVDHNFQISNLAHFPETYPVSIHDSPILFKKLDDAYMETARKSEPLKP